jgi:hypothetical protein
METDPAEALAKPLQAPESRVQLEEEIPRIKINYSLFAGWEAGKIKNLKFLSTKGFFRHEARHPSQL